MTLPELEELSLRERHRRENADDGEGLAGYKPRSTFAAPATGAGATSRIGIPRTCCASWPPDSAGER
jgi:hypothetical protein